ncbi:MAG: tetratricopeptide repeat protein [Desulfuromonadales bacterium]
MRTSLSVILSIIGQVPEALMHLNRALTLDSQNTEALGQKGVCLAKIGYKTQALHCFEKILALDPENSYAQRNKAVILSRLGKEKEALDLLNKVLEDNPDDSHAITEKNILLDEMRLRGTPLGWLFLWVRKTLIPFLHRLRHPRVLDKTP